MSDLITVTGLIATPPRHVVTHEGLAITSFRLASTRRRFDRGQDKWVDGDTNWYTVTSFRQLAINASGSLNKGERIVVTGRVHIREWKTEERSGTTVEIEADSMGHDLLWGTTAFTRSVSSSLGRGADAFPEASEAPSAPEVAVQEVVTPEPAGLPAESVPTPF